MPRSSPRIKAAVKDRDSKEEEEEESAKDAVLKDDTNATAKKSKVKGATKAKAVTPKKATPQKRKKATAKDKGDDDSDNESTASSKASPKKKSKTQKATAKKTTAKKKATPKIADVSDEEDNGGTNSTKKKATTSATKPKKKATKQPVQSITERDELPKLWTDEMATAANSYTLKIVTWNVAGLRAIINKDPQALSKFVAAHDIDILCLQETKLQEMHLDDPKLKLREVLKEEGYDAYYSCSTAKKGYAGTAVFVKQHGGNKKQAKQTNITSFFGKPSDKKNGTSSAGKTSPLPVDPKLLVPTNVSYGLGKPEHDAEGRVIVLDFPGFTMANLYVPNSGQKLERLDYRTEQWDKDLVAYMQEKQRTRNVPVLWLGDLNVAHKEYEAYNFGAKHLDKQAGLTPQERASFQAQLDEGFVDAFRHLHPAAKGHYTYWSQRAGNRLPNKGLRLDYFVCDPQLLDTSQKVVVRDSYMIPDQMGSDHGPAVLELEIKP